MLSRRNASLVVQNGSVLVFVGDVKERRFHFGKAESRRVVQLIDGQQKVAEVSTGDTQDLVVTVVGEEFHEAFAEELHVDIGGAFVKNFGQA